MPTLRRTPSEQVRYRQVTPQRVFQPPIGTSPHSNGVVNPIPSSSGTPACDSLWRGSLPVTEAVFGPGFLRSTQYPLSRVFLSEAGCLELSFPTFVLLTFHFFLYRFFLLLPANTGRNRWLIHSAWQSVKCAYVLTVAFASLLKSLSLFSLFL